MKNKPSNRTNQEFFDQSVKLAKKVNTSMRFLEGPTEKQLDEWPPAAVYYIEELENILTELGVDAHFLLRFTEEGEK